MEVFNAYTGDSITVDVNSFGSLEDLRSKLAKEWGVTLENMLLLVAPGATCLNIERCVPNQRVFLYDRELIAARDLAQSRLSHSTAIPPVGTGAEAKKQVEQALAAIAIIDEGIQLALAHMNSHLRSIAKVLRSKHELWNTLDEDRSQCANWKSILTAIQKVPALQQVSLNAASLESTWTNLNHELDATKNQLTELDSACVSTRERASELVTRMASKPSQPPGGSKDVIEWMNSKRQAQDNLCDVLRKVATIQLRVGEELRPQITAIRESLVRADQFKTKIAEVVDLPFIQGALYIESLRRRKWALEMAIKSEAAIEQRLAMREREAARNSQWDNHYHDNELVHRLSDVFISKSDKLVEDEKVESALDAARTDRVKAAREVQRAEEILTSYLKTLTEAGLEEIVTDLGSELDAMNAELMNGQDSKSKNDANTTLSADMDTILVSTKNRYESRIRQLENMLLQVRMETPMSMSNTSPETISRANQLSEQHWTGTHEFEQTMNSMGLQSSINDDGEYIVNRVKGLTKNPPPKPDLPACVNWASIKDAAKQTEAFEMFQQATEIDYTAIRVAVAKRFGDVERLARRLQLESKQLKDRCRRAEHECRQRLTLHSFSSGDLILFLPTRGQQQQNPWAAFNAGAPHYFLHPEHARKLVNREYLIARATDIESHKVQAGDSADENPFGLAVDTQWYLISVQGEWGV